MKILMVCLGNICRSPLAHGIMQQIIEEQHLDWEVDSAGTGAYHINQPPDQRSIEMARQNGIDISTQRARQISPKDLEDFDLIFAMDSENYQNILRLANSKEQEAKVRLILNESTPNQNRSVPDPYYGGERGFYKVFQLLDEAIHQFVSGQSLQKS